AKKKTDRAVRDHKAHRAGAALAPNGHAVPRELISATRAADIVSVPRRRCLAIDGAGSPKDPAFAEAFAEAIAALYGTAYAPQGRAVAHRGLPERPFAHPPRRSRDGAAARAHPVRGGASVRNALAWRSGARASPCLRW